MEKLIITKIDAKEIIDNKGVPTVRVYVWVNNILSGVADVPCGSSTGTYEAKKIRDGENRYRGKGVKKAIQNIRKIIFPQLHGKEVTRQREIDRIMIELDGTSDKSNLGANAILGVSLAVVRAAAKMCNLPLYHYIDAKAHMLPVPQCEMINGGLHAGNGLSFQEFSVMPVGAKSFSEAVEMLSNINQSLKHCVTKQYGKSSLSIGDDGALAPPIQKTEEALEFLYRAVEKAGYQGLIYYAIDVAANYFYVKEEQKYFFEEKLISRKKLIDFYKDLTNHFPEIYSIEDPLFEEDFEGTALLSKELKKTKIIGDDLFVTNLGRLKKGIKLNAAKGLIWKPDQIGTLSEALGVAYHAFFHKYEVIVSNRSSNTGDDILTDLCVALNAKVMKTGGISRNRNYNRLLEIEDELGEAASYAGGSLLNLPQEKLI